MSDWKKINTDLYNYSYGGFLITYTFKIIERRAVDYMKATKEIINDQGNNKKINFEATGDTFEDVKEKIGRKIDAYNETGK